jgi:hypothetical protein
MGVPADLQIFIKCDAPLLQAIHLFEQGCRINHNAIPYDAVFSLVQNTRGDEVQDEFFLPDNHGMARIMAALIARDNVRAVGQEVNDLSLALIAPLGADNN